MCWSCEWMSGKWGSAETQSFVLAPEIFLLCDLLKDQVNMASCTVRNLAAERTHVSLGELSLPWAHKLMIRLGPHDFNKS